MNWSFSRQVWFLLLATFSFGFAQSFLMLFLNFYLHALGMGAEWQGFINAIPAFSSMLLALPAVLVARRLSNANTLKLGGALAIFGMLFLIFAQGAVTALIGVLLQGCGAAFLMVSSMPFLANSSTLENRDQLFSVKSALLIGAGFFGNVIGGQIPHLYSQVIGGDVQGVSALRMVFVVAFLVQMIGLCFLMQLKPTGKVNKTLSFRVDNWPRLLNLVVLSLLIGLGAGATIPFLNIFIEGKFNISYQSLGGLFALSSLATASTILLQPFLVRYVGQLKAVLLVQALSLPFLVFLGFSPYLWLVTIALMVRGAFMNASTPIYESYAMKMLSERDRSMFSALNFMCWNLGWGVSSMLSGLLRKNFPFETAFNLLFYWTITLYIVGIIFVYWRFVMCRPIYEDSA